jgi:glycosyltransferase involved in cell wall biosynthesis
MSLIICTKDRASQLQQSLKEIASASIPPCDLEVVLVDNGSIDSRRSVIQDFADAASLKVECVKCEISGSGRAKNFGISASKGEWLLFTDDDCYVERAFFPHFFEFVKASSVSTEAAKEIRYGLGPIAPYDQQHDPRVANLSIEKIKLIPPKSLLLAEFVVGRTCSEWR